MSNFTNLNPKADPTMTIDRTQAFGLALSRGTSVCAVIKATDRPAYVALGAIDGAPVGSCVWRPPVC